MEFQVSYDWKEWEKKKHDLLKFCMEGEWEMVVDMYDKDPSLQYAQLTALKETALHIAVSEGPEDIVHRLVESIDQQERRGEGASPLWIPNDRGNTPLHQAALIGNVDKCMSIARKHEELVGFRNNRGETPLFLAALRGKKDTFLFLDQICDREGHHGYRRGRDGETILHVAITGEYFDLAYHIICKHDQLIYFVNDKGYTPLHLLATKPAAFRSGCDLHGFTNRIIYDRLHVKKLNDNLQPIRIDMHQHLSGEPENPKNPVNDTEKYPRNYKTCIDFLQILLKMLQNIIKRPEKRYSSNIEAEERPQLFPYSSNIEAEERPRLFPPNYDTSIMIIKSICGAMLFILELIGLIDIEKLREKKRKNTWSVQILDLMLRKCSHHYYDDSYSGLDPRLMQDLSDMHNLIKRREMEEELGLKTSVKGSETPLLLAAKNGVTEMVEQILSFFPRAILDRNSTGKNIVLVAVENRQTQVYMQLLYKFRNYESAFRVVDNQGNSALHVAATLGDYQPHPFAALQMQWAIKWYKFVKNSVPRDFFMSLNNDYMTSMEVFKKSHQDLVKEGSQWLVNASNLCSVVATVVTTVAFATTANPPGGMKEGSSRPNLERDTGFIVFAISSLIALSFSVTSVVSFLAILTPRHSQKDFEKHLPRKFLYAITYLFISLAAMLVCFCAGHFFLIRDDLEHNAFLVYGIACLPVAWFAMKQFPFYIDLVRNTFDRIPRHKPSLKS